MAKPHFPPGCHRVGYGFGTCSSGTDSLAPDQGRLRGGAGDNLNDGQSTLRLDDVGSKVTLPLHGKDTGCGGAEGCVLQTGPTERTAVDQMTHGLERKLRSC